MVIPSLDSLAVENVAQYADLQALAKIKSTAEYAIKIAKDDAKAESISEATKTEKITARNKISRFLRYSTAEDVSMFMDFIVESIQDADAAFKSTIQKFLLSRTSNESQRSLIIDRVSGQEGGMHQKATEDEKLKLVQNKNLVQDVSVYSTIDQAQADILAKRVNGQDYMGAELEKEINKNKISRFEQDFLKPYAKAEESFAPHPPSNPSTILRIHRGRRLASPRDLLSNESSQDVRHFENLASPEQYLSPVSAGTASTDPALSSQEGEKGKEETVQERYLDRCERFSVEEKAVVAEAPSGGDGEVVKSNAISSHRLVPALSPELDPEPGPATYYSDPAYVCSPAITSTTAAAPKPSGPVHIFGPATDAVTPRPCGLDLSSALFDPAPESAPDSAPNSTLDPAPDLAPDLAPDPTPDSASDSASDSAPVSAPDSAPDPAPDPFRSQPLDLCRTPASTISPSLTLTSPALLPCNL